MFYEIVFCFQLNREIAGNWERAGPKAENFKIQNQEFCSIKVEASYGAIGDEHLSEQPFRFFPAVFNYNQWKKSYLINKAFLIFKNFFRANISAFLPNK